MSTFNDSRVTFHRLFKLFSKVEIPIIQRDYAQGRSTAEDVRRGLLEAFLAINRKHKVDASLSLDLDFIYGNITENLQTKDRTFCPLDGQQRLTTLFLLHWHAAWVDQAGELFQNHFRRDGKARFSYLVRPSSEEFFDALSSYFPERSPAAPPKPISKQIEDESWFFLSWKHDPTIQSALTMLDAIQETFNDTEGLYAQLENMDQPLITFQLLELEQFGLSDDLYIKMNARGKPLTVFENFKARLEHHLATAFPNWHEPDHGKSVPIKAYFSNRIETRWADLLWQYRDDATHLFDEQFMNLFRVLAIVTRSPDAADFDSVFQELRNDQKPLTFQRCAKLGCLDEIMLRTFFAFLDRLSGSDQGIWTYLPGGSSFNETDAFIKAVSPKSLTYDELLLMYAYCGYLQRHQTIETVKLSNWMRVASNLARNTIYNRSEDFQRSLRALKGLFDHADTILEYFSQTTDEISGFNEQQVLEEKLKAQLLLKSADWQALIFKAEAHGYFAGQIEFLFKFSGLLEAWMPGKSCQWDAAQDATFCSSFSGYYEKADRIFGPQGLREFPDLIWERALLAQGKYLIESGRNLCFLKSEGRETSWKRLLRGNLKKDSEEKTRIMVKQLFDKIDVDRDAATCLQEIISSASIDEEWRRILVADPQYINSCENRLIRWSSPERIYLLRRTQMGGLHSELFSYDLYQRVIKPRVERQELPPFNEHSYWRVDDTESEPYIKLSTGSAEAAITLHVYTTKDDKPTYAISIEWPDAGLAPKLVAHIIDVAGFSWSAEPGKSALTKTVPRTVILEELQNVGECLTSSGDPQK